MDIAIRKLFARLLFRLYELLDNIFELFGVLCGTVNVQLTDGGKAKSLIEVFLTSNTVSRAFFLIFLIGIAVAGISTIFAIIKTIVNLKGGEVKSQAHIVGQGLGAVITSLVVALVLLCGIVVSNTVLKEVYNATTTNPSVTLSAQLFDMAVGKTYATYKEMEPRTKEEYNEETQKTEQVLDLDENGKIVWEWVVKRKTDDNGNYIIESGWQDGNSPANLDFSVQTPDDIFGIHDTMWGLEMSNKGYDEQPMVEMDSFNFGLAYLTVIIILVAVIWSMLGLVKRIYDLILLFLVLPLISGTIPLDDGARFKHWRDSVVSKVVLAYGVVLSINIFMLIMPVIGMIDFNSIGWSGFNESLFKCFLLMGGALSINGGQLLVARLMGSSAEESREMAQSARALASGVMAAGGLARGAKNVVFGGYNKYGRYRKGIIPWGAEKADRMASKYGGDGYQGSKRQRFLQWVGRVQPSYGTGKGFSKTSGGLSGTNNTSGSAASEPARKAAENARSGVVSALTGNKASSGQTVANNSGTRSKGGSIINNIGSATSAVRPATTGAATSAGRTAGGTAPTARTAAPTVGVGGSAINVMQNTSRKPDAPHAGLLGNMLNTDGKGGGYTKPPKK